MTTDPFRPDLDPFRPDVAPYVLDALPAEQRIAFEQHVRRCADCWAAVDEVAALPALLDLVPVEAVRRLGAETDQGPLLSLDDPGAPAVTGPDRPSAEDVPRRLVDDLAGRRSPGPPEHLLENLRAAARDDLRRRRRSRVRAAAVMTAAAAAVAVVLGVLPGLPWSADRATPERVELSAVMDSPMTAEVSLRSVDWGTRIDLDCHYRTAEATGTPEDTEPAGEPGPPPPGDYPNPTYGVVPARSDYSLVVTDVDGRHEQVATWSAAPGTRMSIPAATSVPRERIAGITLHGAQGRTLLRADLREDQRP